MRTRGVLASVTMSMGIAAIGHASPALNKAAAMAAMTDIFTHQDPSAVSRYFTAPYRQHNTHIPDGLEALQGLAQMATTWPGVHTTIYRALADDNLVVLHSAYKNLLNRHETAVAFDLFRFNAEGKIVEHWDALEPLNQPRASGRTQVNGATRIDDLAQTDKNRALVLEYIDQVKIAGMTQNSGKFLDAAHYVEHEPPRPVMFGATEEDLAGRTPLVLSNLRYVARHKNLAEGNFVLVQGEGRLDGDTIVEIYDLFRLKGGKIVEHWDVHQAVPSPAKWLQANGPF